MFQLGDRVRVNKTSIAGAHYFGIEGVVVSSTASSNRVLIDREAQIRIAGEYNKTPWSFYIPTWGFELVDEGPVVEEDWS